MLVSQIVERSRIDIRNALSRILDRSRRSDSVPILPRKDISQGNEDGDLETIAAEHTSDTEMVRRGLFGFVEERTSDVSDTSTHPDDTGSEKLLGVSSGVGSDESETQDEGCLVCT